VCVWCPHLNPHLKSSTRPKSTRPAERRRVAGEALIGSPSLGWQRQARVPAPPLTREASRMETPHRSKEQHRRNREALLTRVTWGRIKLHRKIKNSWKTQEKLKSSSPRSSLRSRLKVVRESAPTVRGARAFQVFITRTEKNLCLASNLDLGTKILYL